MIKDDKRIQQQVDSILAQMPFATEHDVSGALPDSEQEEHEVEPESGSSFEDRFASIESRIAKTEERLDDFRLRFTTRLSIEQKKWEESTEEAFVGFQESIDQTHAQLLQTHQRIDSLNAHIEMLQTHLDALGKEVETISERTENPPEALENIQQEMSSIRQDLASSETFLKTQRQTVAELTTGLQACEKTTDSKVESLADAIELTRSDNESLIELIRNQVDDLSSVVAQMDEDNLKRLEAVESDDRLKGIKETVEVLEESIGKIASSAYGEREGFKQTLGELQKTVKAVDSSSKEHDERIGTLQDQLQITEELLHEKFESWEFQIEDLQKEIGSASALSEKVLEIERKEVEREENQGEIERTIADNRKRLDILSKHASEVDERQIGLSKQQEDDRKDVKQLAEDFTKERAGFWDSAMKKFDSLEHQIRETDTRLRERIDEYRTAFHIYRPLMDEIHEKQTSGEEVQEKLSRRVEGNERAVEALSSKISQKPVELLKSEMEEMQSFVMGQLEALKSEFTCFKTELEEGGGQLTPAEARSDNDRESVEGLWGRMQSLEEALEKVTETTKLLRKAETDVDSESPREQEVELGTLLPSDYFVFEERFRGLEEEIRVRQKNYLQRFRGCNHVLDIGCGRGEFLDLLRENGVGASGIDNNPVMVEHCRKKGLQVAQANAIEFLHSLNDEALDGVFLSQVIEHFTSKGQIALVQLVYRKLKFNSFLIMETMNPLNLPTAATHFYTDLSHQRIVTQDGLSFLLDAIGFRKVEFDTTSETPPDEKLSLVDAGKRSSTTTKSIVATLNRNLQMLNQILYGKRDFVAFALK